MKRRVLGFALAALGSLLLPFCPLANAIDFDAEQVYASVFVVYTNVSVGSGFAIGQNCVVTNAHVVENASEIALEGYDGARYAAMVYRMDADLDVAVLAVADASFTALPIADFDAVKIGDDVYTIGAPNNMAYTLTKGVISAKERVIRRQSYIQIDAAVNAGNSGGPLLNALGEVLGINTLKLSDSEGIGLALPMSSVLTFLTENGIPSNDDSLVSSRLPTQAERDTPVLAPAAEEEEPAVRTAPWALLVALCLSAALNVVLFILLLQKRKKRAMTPDPSERTDFEIEIEE